MLAITFYVLKNRIRFGFGFEIQILDIFPGYRTSNS